MFGRIVKRLALVGVASSLIMNAYAVAPGLYMGLMTGPATNSASDQPAQLKNSAATTLVTPSKINSVRVYL